ncbi:MAG: glycosyltransferase family 39 protein [Candidatus Levybacteria bacterium]|nr:glycosyltransferase family 39 protein [Candidatus Levybacteria bacterium]
MTDLYKKNIILIFLLLIFFVGGLLRFYQLDKVPNGLHIDEAINGVNGYFLLKTGKDSNNSKLPFQTEVFGDYNPTGYAYLTILPIKLFGLNEFSTRFPGAFLGSLTILACYLLTFSIFRNKKVGLLSAFLFAVNPWHIVLSRSSEETLVSLFFVVSGFALVILSFENQKLKLLIPGILLLAVSYFVYFTPRVFVPLVFLAILIYLFRIWNKKQIRKYKSLLVGSFLLLGVLALFLVFLVKGGEDRFKQVSIFGSLETRLVMEEQIREDGVSGTNIKITQTFHNKVVNYFLTYISNYVDYFSGSFLFIKGGLPVWLRVEGMGLVYLIELPFLLVGLATLVTNKNKMHKVPLLWLLIVPMVAAITTDDIPNIRRSLIMLPMIEVISAFGFLYILQNKRKLINILVISSFGIFLTYNFFYFLHQYFVHVPIHRNWFRNEGFGEMVNTVKNSYNNVDKVIVTKDAGGIYPLILFYMKYDPKTYQDEGAPKDKNYGGFGKFFFVPQACPSIDKDIRFPNANKIIYVNKGDCKLKAINQKIIYRKDKTKVFNITYEQI